MANLWIDKSKIKFIDFIYVANGITGNDVYWSYRPDYIMNLAMYDTKTKQIITRYEDENKKLGYLFSDYCIGVKGKKDLCYVHHKEAYASSEIRDCVGGAPGLVNNYKIDIDWGNKYSSYVDKVHRRSILGYNDKYVVLCATDYAVPLTTAAHIARNNLAMQYAINCDGGGSCHLQEGPKVLKKSTRSNSSWLIIYLDKLADFISIVLAQEGKDYIYGADGQVFTFDMLRSLVKYLGEDHYYFNGYSAEEAALNNVQDFDCSGLFVFALRELNLIPATADYSASMLYNNLCVKINKEELRNGDLVFRGGSIGHVGMYYEGKVFHAKGTKYGVVLTNELSTFDKFGRLKYFT